MGGRASKEIVESQAAVKRLTAELQVESIYKDNIWFDFFWENIWNFLQKAMQELQNSQKQAVKTEILEKETSRLSQSLQVHNDYKNDRTM